MLGSVKVLKMERCHISAIEREDFAGLTSLSQLGLDLNRIVRVPTDVRLHGGQGGNCVCASRNGVCVCVFIGMPDRPIPRSYPWYRAKARYSDVTCLTCMSRFCARRLTA